jgi:hypothetical protein
MVRTVRAMCLLMATTPVMGNRPVTTGFETFAQRGEVGRRDRQGVARTQSTRRLGQLDG